MAKIGELRDLSADDLTQRLTELDDQLFRLRLQASMGQDASAGKIAGVRKDIARARTLLQEKRAAGAGA
jgi:large subunit ribosomal protein L29